MGKVVNKHTSSVATEIAFDIYEYLGFHKNENEFSFRVWAPNAEAVYLVGDFCNWKNGIPMTKLNDSGVWEILLTDVSISAGDKYKFKIFGNGRVHYKADPYAFECEGGAGGASVIYDFDNKYKWNDEGWLKYRQLMSSKKSCTPMNIYELHLGAWKFYDDGSPYDYRKAAIELAPYVKQMGYTHIELLPIFDGTLLEEKRFKPTSFYSPNAKYGRPDDFKHFISSMHEAGIGVILDWDPCFFSEDEQGLREFDGDILYERSKDRRFNVDDPLVADYLASNALYWIKEYHADGLCVKNLGEFLCPSGTHEPSSYDFIKSLTAYVKEHYPDVMLIADGAKEISNVTSFDKGCLGFDFKKDISWVADVLEYAKEDPLFRKYHHEKLTYSLTYAFAENFILPFGRDFVCGEGKSLLDKMYGDYWQKFAGLRATLGYMITHPGKKLTFMGTEIGQFCEWTPNKEIEWFLLEYDSHAKLQRYVSELNHFYLSLPPLWQNDASWNGFKWIDPNNRNQSIISYRRIDLKGKELVVVINFTPVVYEDFSIGVSSSGTYTEIFNSDDVSFGGSGVINSGDIRTEGISRNFLKDSIKIKIPPLAMTVLQCKRKNASPQIQHC